MCLDFRFDRKIRDVNWLFGNVRIAWRQLGRLSKTYVSTRSPSTSFSCPWRVRREKVYFVQGVWKTPSPKLTSLLTSFCFNDVYSKTFVIVHISSRHWTTLGWNVPVRGTGKDILCTDLDSVDGVKRVVEVGVTVGQSGLLSSVMYFYFDGAIVVRRLISSRLVDQSQSTDC